MLEHRPLYEALSYQPLNTNDSKGEDCEKCKSTTIIMDSREIKCKCPIKSIKIGTQNTISIDDSNGEDSKKCKSDTIIMDTQETKISCPIQLTQKGTHGHSGNKV